MVLATVSTCSLGACSGDSRPEGLPVFPDAGDGAGGTGGAAADAHETLPPCDTHGDCHVGSYCVNGRCVAELPPAACPADMASVAGLFCMDRYEASRPDATIASEGAVFGAARSRGGVLPWQGTGNGQAAAACEAAGKRLCSPSEWQLACQGPLRTVYGYGDGYEPETCNGIDTHGGGFHLLPTGSLPGCHDGWGVFDLNGNLWEHVQGGDGSLVRGGAYNCLDSRTLHRCDYIPGNWTPTALGFRCCSDAGEIVDAAPGPDAQDASLDGEPGDVGADGFADCAEDALEDAQEAASWDVESGCVEDAPDPQPEASFDAPPDALADSMNDAPVDVTEDVSQDVAIEATEDVALDTADDVLPEGPDDASEDVTLDQSEDVSADVSEDMGTDVLWDSAEEGYTDVLEDEAAPDTSAPCPDDMVLVDSFCIDRYEASHEDATATTYGTSTVAASRAGVLPWVSVTLPAARQACLQADKYLCRSHEWRWACSGATARPYAYGTVYEPSTCNGIDTFCYCGAVSCEALAVCPYPHCFNQTSTEGGGPCGAYFHLTATGAFPDCTSPEGVYDLQGNVWELVDTTDGIEHFRGGAFNCGDSETLHRCDYDADWGPTARGFRCCKYPQ